MLTQKEKEALDFAKINGTKFDKWVLNNILMPDILMGFGTELITKIIIKKYMAV